MPSRLWPDECPLDFVSQLPVGGVGDAAAWPVQCFAECPRAGTGEVVSDPAVVVDRCALAVTFRNDPRVPAIYRDIDLDGSVERIEVGTSGNSSAAMYVFREAENGFVYLGLLNAHPSFRVNRDAAGVPTIEYVLRFGADDLRLQRIQYIQGEFQSVGSEQISADSLDDAEGFPDE